MSVCTGCCRNKESVQLVAQKYCVECASVLEKFDHCVICNKLHNESVAVHARRNFTMMCCGDPDCQRKNDIRRGLVCCEQAEYTNCVCVRSYKCPVHYPDGIHIGTHD